MLVIYVCVCVCAASCPASSTPLRQFFIMLWISPASSTYLAHSRSSMKYILSLSNIWAAIPFFLPIGAFVYWLCWVFIAVRRLSLVAAVRGFSCCRAWAQELWCMVHGSIWDLPRPRIELVSPALADRFSTIGPPGKSPLEYLYFFWNMIRNVFCSAPDYPI